jgi:hypothetical protein
MLVPPLVRAVVGWYGADVSRVMLAATVKIDSYDQLGKNRGEIAEEIAAQMVTCAGRGTRPRALP